MLLLFKVLLSVALFGLAYVLLFRVHLVLFQRLMGLGIGAVLFIFILVPDLSTRVASFFGIGRGVDFILYILNVFWAYVVVRLYMGQQALQAQLTELVRLQALKNAEPPKSK